MRALAQRGKSYTICRYECGALYVRINSSQKHKAYLVLYTDGGKLEIRRDYEETYVLEAQKSLYLIPGL